jgi:hypothetical protein
MTDPTGATPAETSDAATAEDERAQQILAEAVGATPAGEVADEPLGDAGKRALQAERKKASELEKELARYRKAEQEKADAEKSEIQKATEAREAAEKRAAASEQRLLRLEIAAEKGLTPAQAKRLNGATREELEADADEILVDFPAAAKVGTPRPDPSQGARGAGPTIDSRIAEAQKAGDWRTVISLQNEKLTKTI